MLFVRNVADALGLSWHDYRQMTLAAQRSWLASMISARGCSVMLAAGRQHLDPDAWKRMSSRRDDMVASLWGQAPRAADAERDRRDRRLGGRVDAAADRSSVGRDAAPERGLRYRDGKRARGAVPARRTFRYAVTPGATGYNRGYNSRLHPGIEDWCGGTARGADHCDEPSWRYPATGRSTHHEPHMSPHSSVGIRSLAAVGAPVGQNRRPTRAPPSVRGGA